MGGWVILGGVGVGYGRVGHMVWGGGRVRAGHVGVGWGGSCRGGVGWVIQGGGWVGYSGVGHTCNHKIRVQECYGGRAMTRGGVETLGAPFW